MSHNSPQSLRHKVTISAIKTAMAAAFTINNFWCPRLDLNQHAVRHMLLRHTCIPISPLGHADII